MELKLPRRMLPAVQREKGKLSMLVCGQLSFGAWRLVDVRVPEEPEADITVIYEKA